MKRLKYVLSFVLVLCVLSSLSAAAFAETTTYTVRVYDGQSNNKLLGSYTSDYGGTLNLGEFGQNTDATVGIYYRKGLHLAGRDNNDTITNLGSFRVTEDTDLVVSYGFMGSAVAYTVRYVEAETETPLVPEDAFGNKLPSEETFYCSDGDTITVTYRQVVGYVPNTYAYRRTMNGNENFVFTFYYTPETAAAPAAPAEGEVVTDQAPNVAIPDGGVPAANQPQDIIDLDEEDTPLGMLDLGKDAVENGAKLLNALPFGARVGLIGLDLVVIGLIVWAIVYAARRRKGQKEDNA